MNSQSEHQIVGRGAPRAAGRAAFTLIELLTVISIIAVLSALVIPLSSVASAKMKISRAQGELNQLVTVIESYKFEVGSYPPDNGLLREAAPNSADRSNRLALNPLFYELGGATFVTPPGNPSGSYFLTLNKSEEILPATLKRYFNVPGIQNSSRNAREVPMRSFSFKPAQYSEIKPIDPAEDVDVIRGVGKGAWMLTNLQDRAEINPWFYDSSTTNRQNRQTFDLWIELVIGKKTNVIGNWKQ